MGWGQRCDFKHMQRPWGCKELGMSKKHAKDTVAGAQEGSKQVA